MFKFFSQVHKIKFISLLFEHGFEYFQHNYITSITMKFMGLLDERFSASALLIS